MILEDPAETTPAGTAKPATSCGELPEIVAAHLAEDGVAVTNVLLADGVAPPGAVAQLARPHTAVQLVEFERWDNRLLLRGPGLPLAQQTSRRLKQVLERIGSREAGRIRVRSRCLAPVQP